MTTNWIGRLPALLLTLATAPVAAHDLTRAEHGRIAISQCYAACILQAGATGVEDASIAYDLDASSTIASVGMVYLSSDSDSDDDDAEDYPWPGDDDWFGEYKQSLCELAQNEIRLLDGCNAGCADIEAVYGQSDSAAHQRFRHLFTAKRQPLEDAGLWVDYQNSPTPGSSEFVAACDAFIPDDDVGMPEPD